MVLVKFPTILSEVIYSKFWIKLKEALNVSYRIDELEHEDRYFLYKPSLEQSENRVATNIYLASNIYSLLKSLK